MNYKCSMLTWISILLIFSKSVSQDKSAKLKPEIGVCSSIAKQPDAQRAGFRFLIPGVAEYLKPETTNPAFQKPVTGDTLPIMACNSFFPPQMKCVGDEMDSDALLLYAEAAFKHAKERGVPMVIFGSGAARKIPDGFDHAVAMRQFMELCIKLADVAAAYDVKIGLENLNQQETNVANTVESALAICKAVNRPNFGINADIYHMMREQEPAENLIKAKGYIFNCDIAEPENRTPPGVEGTDFTPFLEALKKSGYGGGISVEARWSDFSDQSGKAYAVLKEQLDAVYRK